jgi:ribose 5-phosphate isomerase B
VRIPERALVTPLAAEEAWRRELRLSPGPAGAPTAAGRSARTVAVGADHGGFALKQDVIAWIRELGHVAVDLGTHDESPVDYPDVARRVAEAVASERCALGVLIDGAGIGSGMAANKVPGVRAATCWDEASARNAREHNHANVLSIGGRMLPHHVACATVRAFLSTVEGGDRHARRVAKIHDIERAYSRRP